MKGARAPSIALQLQRVAALALLLVSYARAGPCDLKPRIAAMNAECCDEKTEDCSFGQPTSCNLGCARVLLPFFDDCRSQLGMLGGPGFKGVVARCQAAEEAASGDSTGGGSDSTGLPSGDIFPGSRIITREWGTVLK